MAALRIGSIGKPQTRGNEDKTGNDVARHRLPQYQCAQTGRGERAQRKRGRARKNPSAAATNARKITEASMAKALTGSAGYFFK